MILALDGVTDPQNVGALLRTSFLLGVSGIVASGIGSALASASVASGRQRGGGGGERGSNSSSSSSNPRAGAISHVSKASAGALEVLASRGAVATTKGSSLAPFLRSAAGGGWNVVAAMLPSVVDGDEAGGDDGSSGTAAAIPLSAFTMPEGGSGGSRGTILVLGSEGEGVSSAAAKVCAGSGGFVFVETATDGEKGRGGGLVDSFNVSVAGAILLHRLTQEEEMRA